MRFQENNVSIEYIQNLIEYVNNFMKSNHKVRNDLINKLNKKDIKVLCMICYNILYNKIPINNTDKQKLINFRTFLHKFCRESHTLKKRKLLLSEQKGKGFLPILLPAAIGGLATIVSSLISKKSE